MMNWSLIPEYIALLLILVIMLFFHDKRRVRTFRRTLYWSCLWLSAASIALNILCVHTIKQAAAIPLWINIGLNTLYFWLNVLLCSAIAFYLFQRMLEYVYDKHCLRRAVVGLSAVMACYTALCIWNLFGGVLFYFDAAGNYHRGIYNRVGYLALLIEIIMLIICYVRNRKSVSADMMRVIQIVIPVVLVVGIVQVSVLRSLLLNGTIIALADLVIFLGFQSRPIEQDSLTGIGSRKSLFDEVSLRAAGRQNYQIIAVSLQDFSDVSQKVGHKGGDDLLTQVAHFMNHLHPEGRAYRSGNVEFAVLLPWQNQQEQDALLAHILNRFGRGWHLGDIRCELRFHAAAITSLGEDWHAEQVMTYLDFALNQAKEADTPLLRFDRELAVRYQRKETLLQLLHESIEEHRFQVWYQPVYCHETGTFTAAEALLRLKDRQGNPISPEEFIPLAEEHGLIHSISWIVIEQVCALLGSGAVPDLQQVSVNLSMRQFLQPDLLEHTLQLLEQYGVSPQRLKFEITERVLLDDPEYTKSAMERMKQHQIGFYLDDFGTGYANFSSVLDLPFEVVKLDRTLLSEHPDKPKARMLPGVLIPFFHSLGQQVVAEGVETKEQAQWMRSCGADRIQGYYYAMPMPQDSLVRLLREQRR